MTMGKLPAWAVQRVSRRHEKLIQAALFLCAALSVLTTAAIILVLLGNAVYAPGARNAFFEQVSLWEFLTGTHWKPVDGPAGRFGIIPLLSGTIMVSVIESLLIVPDGIGADIYIIEYAAPRERIPEAGPRDTGRNSICGLRLLRTEVHHSVDSQASPWVFRAGIGHI